MKIISLICTFHDERGRISVSKLHRILEHIQSEVVFLEAPTEWRGSSRLLERKNSLESSAVSQYASGRSVELVPVDLPTPEGSFFKKARDFFEVIERNSIQYCCLIDHNKERMINEGFSYLNSESNNKHYSDLHIEILATIENIRSKWISDFYKEWLHVEEQRDIEMLSNIESYCRDNEFSRAVFLVGAAHRNSIISKSSRWELSESAEVQWDYLGTLSYD